MRSLAGPLLLVMLAAVGCSSRAERVWHEEAGYRWAELSVSGGAAGFQEMDAAQTGVAFVNTLRQEQLLANRHYMNGSGVAVGDVDGDGLPDLYFARLDGNNALYRNLGRWRFEDVTDSAGVAAPDRFSTGATLADIDGDGDLDLLVTAMGGPNALYQNDGRGRFREVTAASGVSSALGSTTMALADVDGDGDLDLYVANYKTISVKDLFPPDVRAFERVVVRDGNAYTVVPEFQQHYRLHLQGNRLMRFEYGEPDGFYLNDGSGRFTQVSFTDGAFLDEDGLPLDEPPSDWALTARFQDVNGDGAPDLYVCNDFESPDHFWLGDGRGGFRAAPRLSLRKTSLSTMSVDFSDIDRDGWTDFFLADMLSRDYTRRQAQVGMIPPILSGIGDIDNRPQEMQNTLFLSRGDGTYAEIANLAGVAASEWTWASVFLDVDLDGYEDLLTTTGHAYDAMNADAQLRTDNIPAREWRKTLLLFPDLDLKNLAFRNRGDLTFEAMPDGWGLGQRPDVANALALGDFDGDGDLDAVLNRLDAPAGLFRNTASAPRLAVRLRGLAPNTYGVGARIRVLGASVEQVKEVVAGGQYLSSSEMLYSFAAGTEARSLDTLRIEVQWRSGRRSVVEGAHANRVYEIDEAGAQEAGEVAAEPRGPAPTFEDVREALDLAHHEAAFDDFARQPLLPRRLSQQGPAVAWADLDGDGDDDLLVGSGRGGRLAYARNDGDGRFRHAAIGPEAEGDLAGIVATPLATGGSLVFVGVSNYERAPGDSSYVAVYQMDPNGRVVEIDRLPFGAASVGPLALADLDGDGDLDLFAGGRSVPGRYPEAAASRIFRNDDGRFRFDADGSRPFQHLGLVSGAAAADFDGDADADILLATEWGPVRLFIQQDDGRFEDATAAYGLDAYTGWWNGVAPGDFDGDGRLDFIATNGGWNTRYGRPEREGRPPRVYYDDFDGDGRLDVLEARFEAALGGYVPVRDLATLSRGLPAVRRRVRTYTQFATTTLAQLLGPALDDAPFLEVNTLASMRFLNRGGRFDGQPLPREAQFAPAFTALAGDYDGDGLEDAFLSQNFFALPVQIPRQDAGRGLWLRGDGAGGFASASGVAVYGEQRGAALSDYDGDGRVDLVVTQNGAATKRYRNAGGAVGLRVRLAGPPGNPAGVGALVRLRYADGALGPARLLSAGSGYWSQSSAVAVMGRGGPVAGVWVRWPDGAETDVEAPAGAGEVTVAYRAKEDV